MSSCPDPGPGCTFPYIINYAYPKIRNIIQKHKKAGFLLPLESLVAQVLEPVFGRNGEFLTAVTTAGRKDAASVGGGHTLAETVLVDTFAS